MTPINSTTAPPTAAPEPTYDVAALASGCVTCVVSCNDTSHPDSPPGLTRLSRLGRRTGAAAALASASWALLVRQDSVLLKP